MKSKSDKGKINKRQGAPKVTKGAPSGLVISLILHAVAFFVAGLFVVFTVLKPDPPKWEAPPSVARPKMNLKKPKVKIKKSAQPKPSSRIVAKVKTAKMPEIQIPDLVGTGEGLLGGLGTGGDFMDIPDIGTVSLMGSSESIGSDLVGSYYDFKRKRDNNISPLDRDEYYGIINEFMKKGWDRSVLSKYYRLPTKLYMTALVVPIVPSYYTPVAFGNRDASEGRFWLVHYKGQISHSKDITFRFWAAADHVMAVRLNGEVVVASVWDTRDFYFNSFQRVVASMWVPKSPEHLIHYYGSARAAVGDWVTLKAGEQYDIEIIASDDDGLASLYLMVEEEGVEYEMGARGGRILPVFRTAKLSHSQIDAIYEFLPSDENICLTNGPIFNDYSFSKEEEM